MLYLLFVYMIIWDILGILSKFKHCQTHSCAGRASSPPPLAERPRTLEWLPLLHAAPCAALTRYDSWGHHHTQGSQPYLGFLPWHQLPLTVLGPVQHPASIYSLFHGGTEDGGWGWRFLYLSQTVPIFFRLSFFLTLCISLNVFVSDFVCVYCCSYLPVIVFVSALFLTFSLSVSVFLYVFLSIPVSLSLSLSISVCFSPCLCALYVTD